MVMVTIETQANRIVINVPNCAKRPYISMLLAYTSINTLHLPADRIGEQFQIRRGCVLFEEEEIKRVKKQEEKLFAPPDSSPTPHMHQEILCVTLQWRFLYFTLFLLFAGFVFEIVALVDFSLLL
jgi:hypothetical protein